MPLMYGSDCMGHLRSFAAVVANKKTLFLGGVEPLPEFAGVLIPYNKTHRLYYYVIFPRSFFSFFFFFFPEAVNRTRVNTRHCCDGVNARNWSFRRGKHEQPFSTRRSFNNVTRKVTRNRINVKRANNERVCHICIIHVSKVISGDLQSARGSPRSVTAAFLINSQLLLLLLRFKFTIASLLRNFFEIEFYF